MKRLISLVLLLTMLLGIFAVAPASATETSEEEARRWSKYCEVSGTVWDIQSKDERWCHAMAAEEIGYGGWYAFAALLAGEDLNKERYMEILVNMMALTEYNSQDMIDRQLEADTTKTFGDYAMDAANLVVEGISLYSAFGGKMSDAMSAACNVVGLGWSGAETVIDSIEEFEYFSKTLSSYENHKLFLTAIIYNTTDVTLKSAASTLLELLNNTFYTKIEVVAGQATVAGDFVMKDIFYDEVVMDYMLSDDALVKLSSEGASAAKMFKTAYSFINGLEFAKDAGVFISDVMFGFSDDMNRYTEIIALSQVRKALIAHGNGLRGNIKSEKDYELIGDFCTIAKDLIYVNYRGEYCVSELIRDANGLKGLFKGNRGDAQADEIINSAKIITEGCALAIEDVYSEERSKVDGGLQAKDPERDRNIYSEYIKNELMSNEDKFFFADSELMTKFIFEDLDKDNVYELLVEIYDNRFPGVKGFINKTYLLDIVDGNVTILDECMYPGGTMYWFYMDLYRVNDRIILKKDEIASGGYGDIRGTTFCSELTKDGLVPIATLEQHKRGSDLYGDDVESNVKKETSKYSKTREGDITYITTYKIGGEYVYEQEYVDVRPAPETQMEYYEKRGNRANPLPIDDLGTTIQQPSAGEADNQISDFNTEGYEKISSGEDLMKINRNPGGSFVLTNDIDLLQYGNWKPLCSYNEPFTGILDGNGYCIKNMSVDITYSGSTDTEYAGLFSCISAATIRNLGITDSIISISSSTHRGSAGAFAGNAMGEYKDRKRYISDISNCYADVIVESHVLENGGSSYNASMNIGAFFGEGSANFTNCYSVSTPTAARTYADQVVGGFIGWFDSDEKSPMTIKNCYNLGLMEGRNIKGNYPGAFVGYTIDYNKTIDIVDSYYGTYANDMNDQRIAVTDMKDDEFTAVKRLSTEELKNKNSYIGFDFNSVWAISPDKNDGYPYLRSQRTVR